jgi:hypothetical protein
MTAIAEPTTPPRCGTLRSLVGFAGFALLAFTLLEFPRHPYNATHDLGSHAAFEYYAAHHFQFGKQVYQNVGPYGYVHYAYTYAGYLPVQKIVLKNLTRLGLFLLVLWVSGRLPRPGLKLWWWASFIVVQPFGWPLAWPLRSEEPFFQQMDWDQDYAYLTIYLAALYLLQPRKDRRFYVISGLVLLLLAFTALTKHTAFVLGGWSVLAICLEKVLRKNVLTAVGCLTAYLLFLVGFWALAGQHLGNLPAFVRGIVAFSSGYNEALMKSGSPRAVLIGLVMLGLLFARSLYNWRTLKQGAPRLLTESALLFVVWKHGIVRADFIHVAVLCMAAWFLAVPFLFVTIGMPPAATGQVRLPWLRPLANGWPVLGALVVLVPVALFAYPECRYAPRGLWRRFQSNLAWVFTPQQQLTQMERGLRDTEASCALPGIKAKVKNARVDYFGYEPGYVLLNGMNYWSRPMPITFAASNEALERANEAFYRDPQTAPEFVICALGAVDGRTAMQDDVLALRALLDNYHPVLVEKEHLLLQKDSAPLLGRAEKKPLVEFPLRFGEVASLEAWKDEPVWMEVEVRRSLTGKLRAVVYKPAALSLGLRLVGQTDYSFSRFVTSMGASGCLLNPLIENNSDLLKLYERGEALSGLKVVESFAFGCDPASRKFFKDEVRVRLYTVAWPRGTGP